MAILQTPPENIENMPPEKEIKQIRIPEQYYIPTGNDSGNLPQETNHAKALAIRDLSSPSSPEAILTMSKLDRRAILIGQFLTAFEKRWKRLKGIPNNLVKPLYPPFTFFSDMKHGVDMQSVGDGSARMELTQVLSVPEMGFGFGGNGGMQGFQNLRANYQHELPEHLQPKQQEKKGRFRK